MLFSPWAKLENKILQSQNDPVAMNDIISEHQGFIHKCIQDYRHETGDATEDDQTTVAMMAFKEAVERYEKTKGKFMPFAALIIKRRLIDQYRSNARHGAHTFGSFDDRMGDEGERESTVYEIKASIAQHQQTEYRGNLVLEIEAYKQALSHFQLQFSELVEQAPKSDDLKSLYVGLAQAIHDNTDLKRRTTEQGRLPIQELELLSGVNRKKIERGRKYILAVFVLMSGDFEMLSQYIKGR